MAKSKVQKTDAQKAVAQQAKADRFVKLAKARTSRAIKTISLLQNLGRGNYVYTEEQARQIIHALDKAVAGVATSFGPKGVKLTHGFDFE